MRNVPPTPPGHSQCKVGSCAAGCGAAWLARLTGGQEVPGSNPGSPTRTVQVRRRGAALRLTSLNPIPTGLPPRSGTPVICRRQFGTCLWTSTGLGWNDDGTALRYSTRWADRSGTSRDPASPGRPRWRSRCSVGSPTGPLTPLTGPLASASTVDPSDVQSSGRGQVSGPPQDHFWRRQRAPSGCHRQESTEHHHTLPPHRVHRRTPGNASTLGPVPPTAGTPSAPDREALVGRGRQTVGRGRQTVCIAQRCHTLLYRSTTGTAA